jgi:prepilin-type N-terminal cleavage/methylation domain-containing protein
MDCNLHSFTHMRSRSDNPASKNGFTLVELLVVMGVIAILVIIVLPQYSMYTTRGCNAAAMSDLKNFKAAMESFFADHASYPSLLY